MKLATIIIAVALLVILPSFIVYETMGAGGFKRMVKITGVYSVCKPDKYDVVCFLDADSKNSSPFCMPLSQAGGQCK